MTPTLPPTERGEPLGRRVALGPDAAAKKQPAQQSAEEHAAAELVRPAMEQVCR